MTLTPHLGHPFQQPHPFLCLSCHSPTQLMHEALARSGDDMEIISVRSVDVQLMKEAVREVREKMAKAAAEFEYKLYEKEKELTRWDLIPSAIIGACCPIIMRCALTC